MPRTAARCTAVPLGAVQRARLPPNLLPKFALRTATAGTIRTRQTIGRLSQFCNTVDVVAGGFHAGCRADVEDPGRLTLSSAGEYLRVVGEGLELQCVAGRVQ